MATYNDGHRHEESTRPPIAEPESSSTRASRIRSFLESHDSSPSTPAAGFPVPNMQISLSALSFLSTDPQDWMGIPSELNHRVGLPPSFLDTLDRVDKKTLKKDDICPICTTPYLEEKYPLIVKLRCGHKFDLECVGIWFKEHSNCPMCRQEAEKKKPDIVADDDEEYDDTYS